VGVKDGGGREAKIDTKMLNNCLTRANLKLEREDPIVRVDGYRRVCSLLTKELDPSIVLVEGRPASSRNLAREAQG
jgi:hypothetical protein